MPFVWWHLKTLSFYHHPLRDNETMQQLVAGARVDAAEPLRMHLLVRSEVIDVELVYGMVVLSRPLGAFPKRQTEVAHSPRFLGVTVYVVCSMYVALNHKNQSFDPVRPCAGLHIRSGRAPGYPRAFIKKRFSVID